MMLCQADVMSIYFTVSFTSLEYFGLKFSGCLAGHTTAGQTSVQVCRRHTLADLMILLWCLQNGNTDAEGRLILADALFEAASEKPDLLVVSGVERGA